MGSGRVSVGIPVRRRNHYRRRAGRFVRLARRLSDSDDPEHPVVLQPGGSLDEGTEIEAIDARRCWRLDRELEPGDLAGPDVFGWLDRKTVVARPAGVR